MRSSLAPQRRFLLTAVLFEGGLGVVAVILGLVFGPLPWTTIVSQATSAGNTLMAIAVGLVATLPMVAALAVVDRFPIGPLKELQELVDTRLVPLFLRCSWLELFLVAALAGVGEELLFRGWLQAGLTIWIGPPWGVVVGLLGASLLFGVCHWLSTTYAVLAALVGLYFGWLYMLTDNLLTPIVTHGAYDLVALVYLVKWKPSPHVQPTSESQPDEQFELDKDERFEPDGEEVG